MTNVVKIDEKQKEKDQTSTEEKPKRTVETYWCDYLKEELPWCQYTDDGNSFEQYRWDGKVWVKIYEPYLESTIENFMATYFPSAYRGSTFKSIKSLTNAQISNLKKTMRAEERNIISVDNGFLEICLDGSIRYLPHDDNLFVRHFVKGVEVDLFSLDGEGFYTPQTNEQIESKPSKLSKLLLDCFPNEDVRRYFQDCVGDTLLKENQQICTFLIGAGGGGKSQVLELVTGLHYAVASIDPANLRGFKTDSLVGKTLVSIDEIDSKIDEAMFKRIFGGAMISVDRKYKGALEWKSNLKGFGAINNIPRFSDQSEAMNRRFNLIPVAQNSHHQRKDRIKDIAHKILNGYFQAGAKKGEREWVESEKRDWLDFALNGAIRVIQNGFLTGSEIPLACQQEKEELRGDTDPVWTFVSEFEFEKTDGKDGICKEELYQLYGRWAERNGRGKLSMARFGRELQRVWVAMHGAGMLCDKAKVKVATPTGIGYKPGYKIKAGNPMDYQIEYSNFTFDK